MSKPNEPKTQTVSDALKHAIEKFPTTPIAEVKATVPQDAARWRELVQQRNAQQKKKIKNMRKQLGVSVELLEIAGVTVRKLTPKEVSPHFENHVYIDVHGGAYVFFGGLPSIEEGLLIASRLGITVLSVDYAMPPHAPAPAALCDLKAVYLALLDSVDSRRILVGGTSAGAGLVLALIQSLAAESISLPCAIYTGTPWVDLTQAGDSRQVNEGADRVLVTYEGLLQSAAALYAGTIDLSHPSVSPIYGDFTSFPPVFIVAGTRDLFLSDAVRLHRKIRDFNGTSQLEIVEGLSHAEYLIAHETPESYMTYEELRAFFLQHL